MSAAPEAANDEEEHGAEREAASMRAQLSKEVASWTKERRQQAEEEPSLVPRQPVPERHSRRSASAVKKPNVASVAGKPAVARPQRFSMSYDGQSQAAYIQYLLDRGSR